MSTGFSLSSWFARTEVPGISAGRHFVFQTEDGPVRVCTQRTLAHSSGPSRQSTRARCTANGMEFDLRRLRLSAKDGGLITLGMLEALEREVDLAVVVGSHPHIARCHGSLIENLGLDHCRLLLCDACSSDLASHVRARGGALGVGEVAALGEQLSLGLRHLHSLDILCGSVTAQGVLLGCDGKWKLLGDLSLAAELPISADEWCSRRLIAVPDDRPLLPPELQPRANECEVMGLQVTLALDIWMLGALLAGVSEGIDSRCLGAIRMGNAVLAASQNVLACPLAARFWMLFHWLLAAEPSHRPCSRRLVEIMHALFQWSAHELLIEMPEYARFHCQGMATASARQLAYSSIAAAGINRSCTAGLPLEVLRQSVGDPSSIDQLCENCGIELVDDATVPEESSPDVPALVCVLSVPSTEACRKADEVDIPRSSRKRSTSDTLDADESTDAGSASEDESKTSTSHAGDTEPCLSQHETSRCEGQRSRNECFFGEEDMNLRDMFGFPRSSPSSVVSEPRARRAVSIEGF